MSSSSVVEISASQQELEDLVASILEKAQHLGATQAETGVSLDIGLSVTVRQGEVETVEYQRDRGLGVTVYVGKRKGSASTADLGEKALEATVVKALTIARHTAEDPCAGLADKELMAGDVPVLDLSHPWRLDTESAIALARECEHAALSADSRINNSEGATVSTHHSLRVYGNTHGFCGGYSTSNHTLSCVVLAQEGTAMERDYWYTTARDPKDLEGPEEVGVQAAARTVRRLGAKQLKTRVAPVVFSAELARGLIGHFVAAVRGGSQYRRASFLLDSIGEKVFPEFLDISERPHILKAMASAPFDNEGVITRDRELVERGVLTGYVLNTYSARKLGMQTSGNAGGVHNLTLSTGDRDLAGLLRSMNTGLLVTELMGQGVNPVTGDYSRGAAGLWVEKGEVAYPVHEITIAGNLRDMFQEIVEVGADVDLRGGIRTGSILVGGMTIAGD